MDVGRCVLECRSMRVLLDIGFPALTKLILSIIDVLLVKVMRSYRQEVLKSW